MDDLVIGDRGGQLEMELAGNPVGLQQILRQAVEPALQRLRVGVRDVPADDLRCFKCTCSNL